MIFCRVANRLFVKRESAGMICPGMRRRQHKPVRDRAFSLIELLVVVAVVALLAGLLLPALASARRAARASACLMNVRNLAVAHTMFMADNKERFIDAALSHGGLGDPRRSWPVQLEAYHGGEGRIGLRSPADDSLFWSVEQGGRDPGLSLPAYIDAVGQSGTAPSVGLARWTSYGLNNYLTASKAPAPELMRRPVYDRLGLVPRPSATVHWVVMTLGRDGSPFAKSDHIHAEGWSDAGPMAAPAVASREIALGLHGGRDKSAQGLSNYGFLDGHAALRVFESVYVDQDRNSFYPEVVP